MLISINSARKSRGIIIKVTARMLPFEFKLRSQIDKSSTDLYNNEPSLKTEIIIASQPRNQAFFHAGNQTHITTVKF